MPETDDKTKDAAAEKAPAIEMSALNPQTGSGDDFPDIDPEMFETADNPEANAGAFGLQTAADSEKFLKSKTGESIVHVEIEKIEEEKRREEYYIQAELEKEREKSALLKELQDESEAREARGEQQEATDIIKPPPTTPPPIAEDKTSGSPLQGEYNAVLAEKEKTEQRYKNYDKNIDAAEQFIGTLDSKEDPEVTKKQIQAEIAQLEGTQEQRNKEADDICDLISSGREVEGRQRLDALNARNLQIGALKNMYSVVDGKADMYTKDGERASSFKEADFIVPVTTDPVTNEVVHQKIARGMDEDTKQEKTYLIRADQELGDMTKEQLNAAEKAFNRGFSEMSSVKNLVASNKSIEMTALVGKLAGLSERIEKEKLPPSRPAATSMSTASDSVTPGSHQSPGIDNSPAASQQSGTSSPTVVQETDEDDNSLQPT